MKKYSVLLLIAFLLLFIYPAGAQAPTPAPTPRIPIPTVVPTPTPVTDIPDEIFAETCYIPLLANRAVFYSVPRDVTGELLCLNGELVENIAVRLGTIFYCSPEMDKCYFYVSGSHSPSAAIDENGFFKFRDIVPNRYVLLAHNLYTGEWWLLEINDDSSVFGTLVIVLGSDVDLGTIEFDSNSPPIRQTTSSIKTETTLIFAMDKSGLLTIR